MVWLLPESWESLSSPIVQGILKDFENLESPLQPGTGFSNEVCTHPLSQVTIWQFTDRKYAQISHSSCVLIFFSGKYRRRSVERMLPATVLNQWRARVTRPVVSGSKALFTYVHLEWWMKLFDPVNSVDDSNYDGAFDSPIDKFDR